MKKYKLGFTLIELLVVIAILGILATITLANFSTSQAKGRDAQRKSDLKQISLALEAYNTDHGAYPLSGTVGNVGKIMSCDDSDVAVGTCEQIDCEWGGTSDREFCDSNYTVYMKEIPDDTVSSQHYCYISTDGKSYKLYADLENTHDSDCLSKNASGVCQRVVAHACNGINYTYGIASSNTTP